MPDKYNSKLVKRVMIPKLDRSKRLFGFSTVRDRIVQMATIIAIESIFEADVKDCSYVFRSKRSASQGIEVVRKVGNNKGYYVVQSDIEKFFDRVNQDKQMKYVEQRIWNRHL